MIQLGFKDTELPNDILCSKMVGCFELPFTDVSTDDRSKMRHCIIERAYRSESSLKSMTVREIRDRIRLSIEMSLSLQKRGVCMVEPIYYIKNQCLAYCIPFYAKADMDISKPDGILLVREISGVYKVCTMLDTFSAYNGVVTLDRYPQAAWLKGMVGTDVLKREVKMDHITEEDEA